MLLAGVLAPVPTPFDAQGDVDTARLEAALRRWTASPLSGIVVLGSSGEAAFVDDHDSERVIASARAVVPGDRVLLAGTGRPSTRASIQASRRAAVLGADAVLVITPSAFKAQMTSEALTGYYAAIADNSPVPVILYNFTGATGVVLSPDAIARLSEHPNIIGMKESGSDAARLGEIVRVVPPNFRVLVGSGSSFYASLCLGASGGILALACVLPHACCHLFSLAREGRHAEAQTLQSSVLPLARLLGSQGVPGLKGALRLVGVEVGLPRPPLLPLNDAGVEALTQALAVTAASEDLAPLAERR